MHRDRDCGNDAAMQQHHDRACSNVEGEDVGDSSRWCWHVVSGLES